MAFVDYYKILGVDKNIPQKDVRAAYRKRAKQFHPDLHPDDPKAKAKFQALSEAYEVIGDAEKRRKYDQYGQHWREAEAFGGTGGNSTGDWGGTGSSSPFEGFDFTNMGGGFSSFFQDLFGSRRSAQTQRRTAANAHSGEINITASIDMYTAILGGDVVLQLPNDCKIKLKVKPETQNGTKVRLRGKGYKRENGTFGDMIITYHVTLPTNLSDHQKELLRQMRSSL